GVLLLLWGSPNGCGFNSPLGSRFGSIGVGDASSGVLDSNSSTLTFTRATSVPEPGTIFGLVTVGALACIIHESRVKNPETTTRYKLQRLDLNNSLFCLSVTGLSGKKIMVKKAEKRGQKTL
ncbi:MAG: PEP-CTERM sorting domain-containing protein, partial [Microcystis panniformis]